MSLVLSMVVFGMVFCLWRGGGFQWLELHLYDCIIARRPANDSLEHRVVIVGIDEADIRKYGWALDDKKLSELLERLISQGVTVVGVDLYRDLPEPRSGQFLQLLNKTLSIHTNVICSYNGREDASVPPPPVVADQPPRVGFNDFPVDADGVVRRALLAGEGEGGPVSFAMQLAAYYLRQRGVEPRWQPGKPWHLRLGTAEVKAFEPNDGGYVEDDNSFGFQILLDYLGARKVPVYSLEKVLSGLLPEGVLRGRIVLVGVTAQSVNDFVNTPLKSDQLGLLLHAQVVDQLLRMALDGARPTRFPPGWLEWLCILGACAFGCCGGYWFPSTWRLSSAIILLGLGILAAIFWSCLYRGWWIPLLPAATGFLGSALIVASCMSVLEKRMRAALRDLYSRHVGNEVADAIWEEVALIQGGQLPLPEKVTVTVLFSDLKGFTRIAEAMEKKKLYEWLNCYLGQIANIVKTNGGLLKQFTGDGVMGIFGAPKSGASPGTTRDDAIQAVNCARAMGRRLRELNVEWQNDGKPTVSMRVGICSGEVLAANVGTPNRFEYTVIGDVVNTASRLESLDRSFTNVNSSSDPCRILICGATQKLIEGTFPTEPLGRRKVPGKKERIDVFQVRT